MKRKLMVLILICACVGFLQTNANAAFLWNWSLDAGGYVINPNTTININGTLTNLSTDGEYITSENLGPNWGLSWAWESGLDVNDSLFTATGLEDINLAPGESGGFQVGWWSIGDNVGTYNDNYVVLTLIQTIPEYSIYSQKRYFSVAVGQGGTLVVPESATIFLLGSGLVGVFIRRKRKA